MHLACKRSFALFALFCGNKWKEIETFCVLIPLWMPWPGIDVVAIVVPKFIKISETITERSLLTILLNGSVDHLEFFQYWLFEHLWIANVCHHAKFHQNWSKVCKDIVKVWIFHYFSLKTVICTIFRCFGLKNRRKLKLSAFSSLYQCTDLELELQWLICIVVTNFIKIS